MIKFAKVVFIISSLFLSVLTKTAIGQIDEQYYGEKFKLLIAIWPEEIRSSCSVFVGEDKLEPKNRDQMKNIYISKEFNQNQIDSIKIFCNNYYTHKFENYRFKKPGINIYPILLSQRISFNKSKDCDVSPYNLKYNLVLKLKDITFPDSLKDNVYYRDLDIDKDGNLFVVDAINNRIINDKIKFTGVELDSPEGIAIDSEGNIYITDWGNQRIVVFNSAGDFIQELGEKGKLGINKKPNSGEKVKFVFPTRIAVEEDTLTYNYVLGNQEYQLKNQKHFYISDRFGVQKVDSNGYFLEKVIGVNNDFPEASFYGIAVKGYGKKSELFVVERKNGKIKKLIPK